MSQEERMLKVKLSLYGRDITELIRDGTSSMLIKLKKFQERASMLNSVCTETDHSSSDQDSQ